MKITEPIGVNSNYYFNKYMVTPSFRADIYNQNNTVELTKNNQPKISKTQKWLMGGGLALLLVGGGVLLKFKSVKKNAQKLYEQNMVLSELPEKIEFKAAKTLEEAKKFTREVLGIKNIDEKFSLEGLNYANEGITNISNANKGKIYIPPKWEFVNSENDMIAGVAINPFEKSFGTLIINSKYFDHAYLDGKIAKNIMPGSKPLLKKYSYNNGEKAVYYADTLKSRLAPYFEEKLTPIFDKYYTNPQSLTIEEKRLLWTNLDKCAGITNLKYSPLSYIHRYKEKFEEMGIKFSVYELMKKTQEEQLEFVKQSFITCEEKGSPAIIKICTETPLGFIYHEVGHWQDLAKNLKPNEIDVEILEKFENRWGALHYENCKRAWDKGQDYFKKKYPELHEFITDQEIQLTASEVSSYAQTGIGEFIAETYSGLISGKKFSDKVMNLYKKYNGPTIG